MSSATLNPDVIEITPQLVAKHGLNPEEYERIEKILGRTPNINELGVFSVMWSEHCSYKNTRPELKKFPTTGPRVLVKAGEENAGVIDIGDGWAVAFKMESHNHPSAIEPFQGAATGVGGIIRDIFTMGARPVFSLNSLRFGSIGAPVFEGGEAVPSAKGSNKKYATARRLFAGVVEGISHYGNCIGVPTIGGEVYFDESYEGNPLVNVFCLGILKHEQIARGAAKGVGNPVFYVGAETGRDGLAGAAFASRDLTEASREDRPAVQVGDPFKEKLLLEACLELLTMPEAVAGIQDMGAAGLTCSTCETASRAGTGVEIDLNKVPQREKGMTPYEILLSESQERMLIIVNKGHEEEVRAVFQKWDLPCAEIGRVTNDGMMRVKVGDVTAVEIPAKALADEAPVYHCEVAEPKPEPPLDLANVPEADSRDALLMLLANPSIASKNWVWRQYDYQVRLGNMVQPGAGDAAVFYVHEADKILAATSDVNSLYCRLDPREGAKIAVAEAARNLTCTGATPLAVTDNLNFGNPYRPENFWTLRECVEGLSEACREFQTPVTGGNVSLYNESPSGAVDPTPTVGMVGIIEDKRHVTAQGFQQAGDVILLIGDLGNELGASQYLKVVHGRKMGKPPKLNFQRELAVQNAVRHLIKKGLVRSAHDCSEGGLAVAIAESCICANPHSLGAHIKIDAGNILRLDQLLFNESQSRIVISVSSKDVDTVLTILGEQDVVARKLGYIRNGIEGLSFQVKTLATRDADLQVQWNIEELNNVWKNSIQKLMEE